jgi:hypothetical protein
MDPWCAELQSYWVRDGDFDRRDYPYDEGHYEASELVDSIYTSDWTGIVTVEQATDFVTKLWEGFADSEKAYVAALYLGRDVSDHERDVVMEILDDRETDALLEEAKRERDVAALGDIPDVDIDQVPFKLLNEQLVTLRRHLESRHSRPSVPAGTEAPVGTVQAGGSGADKLYRLMALADSLHDFGDEDVDKAGIQAAIGADIPVNLERAASKSDKHVAAAAATNRRAREYAHHDFRYGDSTPALEFIADEATFIDFLNENDTLDFPGEPLVRHNMHGIDMLRQFDKRAAFDDYRGLYWLAYLRQRDDPAEAMKADVWALPQKVFRQGVVRGKSPPKNHKDIVFMSQIIHAVHKIKAAFGDGKLVFIMDKTDNQLHRMLLGSATLYAGIGRMLIVIGWNDELLSTDGAPTPRDNWSVQVCDANLLDGNTHFRKEDVQQYYPNPELSATPTGDVFRPGLGQVRLGGVIKPEDPMVRVTVGAGPTRTYRHTLEEFSIAKMATLLKSSIEEGRLEKAEQAMACKRACDWGQVRHCAVMDEKEPDTKHVFVSPEDRMACLYAVHENVNAIFIKCNNDNNTGWPPFKEVLQTTFTLLPKREAATQTGGGREMVAWVMMVAVVVAAAFH